MATLEITLLLIVIYLLIVIVIEFFRPEEHFLMSNPVFEKFLTIMTIFFWSLDLVDKAIDYRCDIFE